MDKREPIAWLAEARRRYNDITANIVKIANGCWLHSRHGSAGGYGQVEFFRRKKRKVVGLHRVMYALHNDTFDENLFICHHCDTPRCVNPAHLFAGTHSDNMQDCIKKGRHNWASNTHCKRGHAFTDANTYVRTMKDGSKQRNCRKCRVIRNRKYRKKLQRG